ncbi:MAG: hypothetical protein RLZZ501_739 [Pseudomonadota bacterium]
MLSHELTRSWHGIRPVLWLYAVTVLTAHGTRMMVPTFGGDDWHAIVQPDFQYDFAVAIGRWMFLLVWRLADGNSFAPATEVVVLSLALLLLSQVFCLALGVRRPLAIIAFASLAVSFPLMAETFSFKEIQFSISVGILFATLGGLMAIEAGDALGRGRPGAVRLRAAAAMGAIVLSAACSQQTMQFTLALLLARLIGRSRQPADQPAGAGPGRILALWLLILAGGLVLYAGSVVLSQHLLDIAPLAGRGGHSVAGGMVRSPEELLRGIGHFLHGLGTFLFLPNHLFPLPVKLVFYAALAACLWFAPGRRARLWLLAGTLLLLVLPFSLAILRVEPVFRFTALIALAVPYAMVFVLAAEHLRERGARTWASVALVGLTLVFCFEQNKASLSTVLLNQRDRALANRILTRLQSAPDFAPFAARGELPILVVGHLEERALPYPFAPDAPDVLPPLSRSIDSCGIFNCQNGRLGPLLRLIGETTMRYPVSVWPSPPASMTAPDLAERIAAAPPWPAPDSLIWTPGGVVLVLGRGGQ